MSIIFSEHFQLIFDNSNVSNDKKIKQKIANFFSGNFSELSNVSFLILLREANLQSKVAPTNRNSSAFLLHTNKTFFQRFVVFHKFFHKIFAIKIKTMLLNQAAVLFTNCQKKYCVYYVSEHLKYCTQINEYWLNKNACLNIV